MDTALDPRPAIALSWAMIAAMALITLASLAWLGVSAAASSIPVGIVALVATLLGFHLRLHRIPQILIGTAALLQFCLILPIGMLLSFAAAASDAPFRDGLLLAADRAIGFDWMAYARWVDSRPWVAIAYRVSYLSFMMQPLLLIVLLAWHGEFRRLHLFSFAFTFTLTVTCLIFYFVPAVSIYAHLQVPPEGFRNLQPVSTFQRSRVHRGDARRHHGVDRSAEGRGPDHLPRASMPAERRSWPGASGACARLGPRRCCSTSPCSPRLRWTEPIISST